MNYHHLSIEERLYTEILYGRQELSGDCPVDWAKCQYSIGEIRRNCTHMYDIPTYYPHTAQKKYLLRRSYCHRGMFHSQEVIEYINEKLKATWSPEQISCTPCALKMPSWRTIYRWIYEKYLVNGNLKYCGVKEKAMETRKHAVNTAKGNPFEKGTNRYTAARKQGTGKPIRW